MDLRPDTFTCFANQRQLAKTRIDDVATPSECGGICVGDPACTGFTHAARTCELIGRFYDSPQVYCTRFDAARAG